MRDRIRELLRKPEGPPLREVIGEHGAYPLLVITSLNFVDELDRAVMGVFAPNLQRYFDLTDSELAAIVAAQVTLLILVGVPIGYLGTRIDRARILRWSATFWTAFSTATAFAIRLPAFVIARIGTGIGKAAVEPVGKSLLTDEYPPYAWNRVLAFHSSANPAGQVLGPLGAGLIGVLTVGDAGWRWAFPILTVPTVIAIIAARRLHEPEQQMVRGLTKATISVTGAPSGLSFRAASMKLFRIPTFKRQLVGIGVLGFALVGVLLFINLFLEEEYGLGEGGRGIVNGILATGTLVGTIIGGRVGERIFQESPARAMRLVGVSIAVFSIILAGAVFLPNVYLFTAVMWFALAAIAVVTSPLNASLSAISEPRLRPLMFSMLGLFVGLFGGFGGAVVVGTISEEFGRQAGLASMFPFGVIGGLLMARSGSTIDADIKAVEDELGDPGASMLGDLLS